MLKTGYINIHNVPSRVVTCGGWLDETFLQGKHKEIVLIIPGNPGLTAYYEEFVEHLYQRIQLPVWIICHAGHELDPHAADMPAVEDFPHLFNVNGQMAHKVEFIKTFIPSDVKIHLIGHSVGCYIILNILKQKLIDHSIAMNYLLFPAIERIGVSPNGKVYQFFAKFLLWLILFLSWFFTILPKPVGKFLVSCYFLLEGTHRKNVKATMHLIHPVTLKNIFFMASDEMDIIQELDAETISTHSSKLRFYFGRVDGWCPLQYYHDLKARLPHVQAELSSTDMRHAFVLNSSKEMAHEIAQWISDLKG